MWKKIFIFVLAFVSSTAFATTLQTSTNIPVLYVGKIDSQGKFSGWKQNIEIGKDDRSLLFHIHSYANDGPAFDVKNRIADIRNLSFDRNNDAIISARIWAENAPKIDGEVKVSFKDDNISFKYHSYTWAIKKMGPEQEEKEHFLKLNPGEIDNVFSKDGVSIRDLEQDYRSNLILYFNIKKVENSGDYYQRDEIVEVPDEKVEGRCGNIKNQCLAGKFLDKTDTKKEIVWACRGENGGATHICKIKKTKKPALDAVCGTKKNSCKKGSFEKYPDDDYYEKWSCKGENGGLDQICMIEKECPCGKLKKAEDKIKNLEAKLKSKIQEDFINKKPEKIGTIKYKKKIEKTKAIFLTWYNFLLLIFIIIGLSIALVFKGRK